MNRGKPKHRLGDGIDWSKVRTRRERRYSAKWLEVRAARKERRKGMPAQPRDDLGFIIVDLKDRQGTVPKAGRKPDTLLAHANAMMGKEMSYELDKVAEARKAKKGGKK